MTTVFVIILIIFITYFRHITNLLLLLFSFLYLIILSTDNSHYFLQFILARAEAAKMHPRYYDPDYSRFVPFPLDAPFGMYGSIHSMIV